MSQIMDFGAFFTTIDDYEPFVLLVLNQDIQSPVFDIAWKRASLKVVADGGFGRLRSWCCNNDLCFEEYFPDYVVGDMDSITTDDMQFLKQESIPIIYSADQDTTDFEKALNLISREASIEHGLVMGVMVFGGLDGRFDHTAASINVLCSSKYSTLRLWLISPSSLVFLIPNVELRGDQSLSSFIF